MRSARRIAKEGLLVGLVGAAIGVVVGTAVAACALQAVAEAKDLMPATDYDYLNPAVVLPAVAVVITTWLASWVGSRRVLRVRPIQAIGNSHEQDREELGRRRARNVIALVLFVVGVALLAVGVVWGLTEPYGVLVGMVGGIVSFTGIVLGAHVVMPPVLRLVGRALGTLARRPPRGRERRAPPRAELAHDDRARDRRHPRDDVRRDDGVVSRDDPRGAAVPSPRCTRASTRC